MGEAITRPHPAVVLRSQFNHLRALLVVALIAVAGLTVAVGILAGDNDELAVGTRGPLPAGLPKTSTDQGIRGPLPAGLPKTSSDEGTRGSATEAKHEAATAAAIGQSNDGTVTRGSKTDPNGPASLLP